MIVKILLIAFEKGNKASNENKSLHKNHLDRRIKYGSTISILHSYVKDGHQNQAASWYNIGQREEIKWLEYE